MFRILRRLLFRQRRRGDIRFAGRWWTWAEICQGWICFGGIGSGKTYSTEALIREMIRAGCPMLFTCVKVNEYVRILKICEEMGQLDRVTRIAPDNPESAVDLMAEMMSHGGTPAEAAHFLTNLGDVEKSGNGGESAAFWRNLEEGAIRYAILLCVLCKEPPSLDNIYYVIMSAPSLPNQGVADADGRVNADYQFHTPVTPNMRIFPRLMRQLYQMAKAEQHAAEFKRIEAFFMTELCGEKIHGPAIAGINGTLGRFIDQPLRNALTNNKFRPQSIQDGARIAIIDYPVERFHMSARLYAVIWTMLAQRYLMARDESKIVQPFVIWRDEAGFTLHGLADMQASNTLRSQGVCDVALIQDLNTLERSLGGTQQARHEAMAFASNHMNKLFFQNYSEDTNKWASAMGGMYREVQISSGQNEAQDFAGKALGVKTPSYSFAWSPRVRVEHYTQLAVGTAILMGQGLVEFIDFRGKS